MMVVSSNVSWGIGGGAEEECVVMCFWAFFFFFFFFVGGGIPVYASSSKPMPTLCPPALKFFPSIRAERVTFTPGRRLWV